MLMSWHPMQKLKTVNATYMWPVLGEYNIREARVRGKGKLRQRKKREEDRSKEGRGKKTWDDTIIELATASQENIDWWAIWNHFIGKQFLWAAPWLDLRARCAQVAPTVSDAVKSALAARWSGSVGWDKSVTTLRALPPEPGSRLVAKGLREE